MERISTFRDFVGELKVSYKRTSLATVKITKSSDAVDFMRSYFDEIMDDVEHVKVLHLNRNNSVVNVHHVSSGSDSGCIIPIKEVLKNAILIKTSGILLFHNHPSGNLKASKADIDISNKLRDACKLLEISMLDSIIITRESYYSLQDNSDI